MTKRKRTSEVVRLSGRDLPQDLMIAAHLAGGVDYRRFIATKMAEGLTAETVAAIHDHPDTDDMVIMAMTGIVVREWSPWVCKEWAATGYSLLTVYFMSLAENGYLDQIVCPCGRTDDYWKNTVEHMLHCAQAEEASAEMEAAIPTHPSNQKVLEQLRLWGVTEVKRSGQHVTMLFPEGEKRRFMSERTHQGNPAKLLHEVLDLLHVSPQMFWAGPQPADDPSPPVVVPTDGPSRKRHKGYVNTVMDVLVSAGCPLSIDRIAEEAHITRAQASSAASRLTILTAVERVKSGVYVAKQFASDYKVGVGVDVTVGAREPDERAPEPVPAPDQPRSTAEAALKAPAPLDVDDTIDTMLDIIFPGGMNVTAKGLRAIDAWRSATEKMLREVKG